MNNKQRLLIIDGHSLAFRAFYALPVDSFVTSDGQCTNAVQGFINMLLRILDKEKPSHVAVAFDLPGGTFRTREYTDYKGGRGETPAEFPSQIKWIEQALQAMRIVSLTKTDYEADDILCTLARQGREAGMQVLVVSGDRDSIQIVNEEVTVLYPVKGVSEIHRFTPLAVEEKYGVTPDKYPDLAAITGEKADNLPGVEGVGPKTAAAWLQKYGDLANLFAHISEIGGKRGQALRESETLVWRNRQLNRLVDDLELEISLSDLEVAEFDADKVMALCEAIEFNQLKIRMLQKAGTLSKENARHISQSEQFLQTWKSKGSDLSLCLTFDVVSWCEKNELAYIPAVCSALGRTQIVIAGREEILVVEITELSATSSVALANWIANTQYKKIVHDGKELGHTLAQYGYSLSGISNDTLLNAYLLDADMRDKTIANLLTQYLNITLSEKQEYYFTQKRLQVKQDYPVEDCVLEDKDSQLALELFVPQPVKIYYTPLLDTVEQALTKTEEMSSRRRNALLEHKTALIEQLLSALYHQYLSEYMQLLLVERQQQDLLENLELPVMHTLFAMETQGIAVDIQKLESLYKDFDSAALHAASEAQKVAGREINLNSPKQIQEVLFTQLGLPPTRKTNTGFSTDAQALLEISIVSDEPFLQYLISYRDVIKLKQMVEVLKDTVSDDGRIHTSFEQAVAATGRISSKNPNLQNIPARTEEGMRIRDCFVAKNSDYTILTADYSQIEMRLMAHFSEDEALLEAFASGEDLHKFVASKVYKIPLQAVTALERTHVKQVSYGLAYGLSPYGLSKRLGISVAQANVLMAEYFSRFGRVRNYLQSVVEQARKKGYTETLLGRRRYLPGLASSNRQVREAAGRAALNAPIQGSAADIIKIAMLRVEDLLLKANLDAKILLQVHDELVLEVAKTDVDAVKAIVIEGMHTAYKIRVALDVSVGVGDTWALAAH